MYCDEAVEPGPRLAESLPIGLEGRKAAHLMDSWFFTGYTAGGVSAKSNMASGPQIIKESSSRNSGSPSYSNTNSNLSSASGATPTRKAEQRRLRSLKRRWLGFVLGSLLVVGFVAGLFVTLEQSGFFNLRDLQVSVGNLKEQRQYVDPLISKMKNELSKSIGQSLWSLNLRDLAAQSSKYPWVESVRFLRRWPGQLEVVVLMKDVKLLLHSKSGEIKPVLEDGSLLSSVAVQNLPDLPLIDGDVFEKKIEMRKKAVEVMESIPTTGSFSHQSIAEIRFDDKEGFWMTLAQEGLRVKLGHDQIQLKSARVSQVMDYIDAHQMQARVIDADLSKKVVVRLRKGP